MSLNDNQLYWSAFGDDTYDDDPEYDNLGTAAGVNTPLPFIPPPQTAASSFHGTYTGSKRAALLHHGAGASVVARVVNILAYMKTQGLNLELFMEAVFWGDKDCTADYTVSHERTVFMRSPTLLSVLDRWWCPPTKESSGGGDSMKEFLVLRVGELLVEELEQVAAAELHPPKDSLSAVNLTNVNFRDVGTRIQTTHAPKLWLLLQQLAWSPRQCKENTQKNPFHVRSRLSLPFCSAARALIIVYARSFSP